MPQKYFIYKVIFVEGMPVPEEVLEKERMAFSLCDSDKMVGLTWVEVEQCEVGDDLY